MPQSTVRSIQEPLDPLLEIAIVSVLINSYCEENIYKLLPLLSETLVAPLADLTVIFISNPRRAVSAPRSLLPRPLMCS